ncbi:unnamed protein product [Paramecium octaurelia]|uniref:Uncharacterized protein n=1 Tax=Paramecium octaurelia TaxID=43137 RepID=A0A8S1SET2_PAROT|nr:unnamed protein product [Paramecium octaurelia]
MELLALDHNWFICVCLKQILCLKIWISYQSLRQNDMVQNFLFYHSMYYLLLLWILRMCRHCNQQRSVLGNHQLYEALWFEPKRNTTWKIRESRLQHSWNAPQRFSNYLLFKLQRHQDHHEIHKNPTKHSVPIKKSLNCHMDILYLQLKNWKHHKKNVTSDQVHQKMLHFIFKIGLVTTTLATASIAL